MLLLALLGGRAAWAQGSGEQPPPPPPVSQPRPGVRGDTSPLPPPIPPPSSPMVSATVPMSDPVYRDLDRLDALGMFSGEVLGQRPFSRGEIARMLRRASQFPAAARPPVREILIRLRREFPWLERGEAQGVDEVRFGGAWLKERESSFPRDNNVGQIDALKQPLTAYRDGRPYAVDGTFWLRTRHTINTRPDLVFVISPEFQVQVSNGDGHGGDTDSPPTESDGDFAFQALYGRLRLGPVILQAGRDQLSWGPVAAGSLMMTNNARPQDMVLLTHESPFRLPWIFRYMGRARFLTFMSYLGEDRVLPKSALLGFRASFRPHGVVEVGFSETMVLLGEGAPTGTFWEYLNEIIPIGRSGLDTDLTDHRYGFDLRIHAWPGHVTLYHELLIEDAREGFWEDVVARRFGVQLPSIGPRGRWELRGEYVRLPAILYRHGRWTSGYTLDRRILGNELGPDSRGALLRAEKTSDDGNRLFLDLSWEGRDRDTWAQDPVPSDGSYDDIFLVEDFPTEERWRARLGVDWRLTPATSWQPEIAVERVLNGEGIDGDDRTNLLVELAFRYRFAN